MLHERADQLQEVNWGALLVAIVGKELAEYASDIQTGIGPYEVSDFDELRLLGMAGSLAVQLRGLPEIEYAVLVRVSDSLFNIPSLALKPVLRILSEAGMVRLYESGRNITKIDPQVPYFENVYDTIGAYSASSSLTETEQAMVAIMAELQKKPENKDRLLSKLGMESSLLDRCLMIGNQSGLISNHRVRGQTVLTSPVYFADNNQGLADLIAKVGSSEFADVMEVIRLHQGWPLSMIISQQKVAGRPLTPVQIDLIQMLASENMLKPPTIEIGKQSEVFLFTPRPGAARLSPGKRDIYERAMALLAAVRKGQLLPFAHPIRKPAVLLQAFLRDGYLGANTEARAQYGKVAGTFNIGYFKETKPGWHQFWLRKTEENIEAVQAAIDLAQGEETKVDMRMDQEARALLQMDDKYVSSVLGSKGMKERKKIAPSAAAKEQWDQLTLRLV
ncbi:hypothetical protein LPC08_25940 (plasmid) [Roseomonas sp. OT10]|uniref:hypothetical protein n=1 Tax=Roseomonas cutis TaxID=2897332 RepID=UPI001E4623C3|nr:hypothetical protein [Roseomonas sp. OT10]UFN51795.1 hypothetical protein LPC08_25940 [Roseomonas sp. OT10]